MNYLDFCINKETTVRSAMKILDDSDPKVLFVVEEQHVLASLTDGDIRRFLLKGGAMTDAAVNAGNRSPRIAHGVSEAHELYHKKNFVAIPIVNEKDILVDIYFGKDTVKNFIDLNIPIVINAGGKGTRLEPYTKILPKPLIPVGDKPIIEHIMNRFIDYGCKKFHIIVNYKKELLKAYFADNESAYDITWYDEALPLGTGGGLCYLKGKIKDTFFFTNCDNLLLSNYDSILRFHKENKNVITMVCAYKNIKIPYGVIDMGLNGSIEAMREKPEISFLTNTGIYIVEPSVLDDVEDGVSIGFPDIISLQQKKGRKVAVYPISEKEWMDMGQFDTLEEMRRRLCGD